MSRRGVILLLLCSTSLFLWVLKEESEARLNMNDQEYVVLREKVHDITLENMLIEQELLPLKSYTYIASKAASLGMVRSGKK